MLEKTFESKPKKVSRETFFTAYIMKGNRQTLKILVKNSKKFMMGKDTYFIKRNCIFTKIIHGKLESVSYYSEGNPNPHNFREKNTGLTYAEFDELYGEDLYEMLIKLQKDTKMNYLLFFYFSIFCMSIITMLSAFI